MRRILLFGTLLCSVFIYSQGYGREITYGLFLGGNYSKMGGIKRSIIPDDIYTGFTTNEKGGVGLTGGLFLNWRYIHRPLGVQPELWYSGQKTEMSYTDEKGLRYKLGLKWNYLNAGFLLKYYIGGGLYMGVGPYFTYNLDKDALKYTSNGAEIMEKTGVYFEPDSRVQRVLKESFEAKDYFHIGFAIGYEFENKINVGIRYHLGLSDAWETLENGHRYREIDNKVNAVSLQIGYRFDFDSSNNF